MKLTMTTVCLALLMLCASMLRAGDANEEVKKKMDKVTQLVAKKKYDDAEKTLKEIVDKYPAYGKAWDQLAEVHVAQYDEAEAIDGPLSKMSFTVSNKDGSPVSDSVMQMAQTLADLMAGIKPSHKAYEKLMLDCRLACLTSSSAYGCAIRLRMAYVDAPTDTGIKKEAVKYFNQAETEFAERNYSKAADLYKKAIDTDPACYKARLYLGDVYYMTKRYTEAIQTFKDAIDARPDLLEPRKYLADAYANSGVYDKAYTTSVDAVIAYPDLSMLAKLQDAAEADKHPFKYHRLERDVLPNQNFKSDSLLPDEEAKHHLAKKDSYWKYYTEAKRQIQANCDRHGMISGAGDITKQHYLEVYSWEYMLSKSDDKSLDFARKMQSKGYLDCYVMLNNFHQDFYDQYRAFADMNKQRIRDYFDMLGKMDNQ